MHKILVAFDGSEGAKRALQYVIDFSEESKRPLDVHILNVQQEPILFGEDYLTPNMVDELTKSLLSKSTELLKSAGSKLDTAGIGYQLHSAVGNVAEKVNEMVKKLGCDTVVMGTRGLGSFSGLLLGSVATRVIHEVPVPVVLVK
ncbi:universal stress protein [Azomonas macrocytogenes]|uniref:Nucleotide-binding universal stress UspA family protein n=1 Tax=Azomonas macrocytogenes TaxID=69962 RepID=A0A839T995_AZOMA|nr:universal stress protein [Azomonas macrocytogenes]MBB3104605.1 nucleotide-binding universal stress UspA family protein [Azomonas macrocytogenes]